MQATLIVELDERRAGRQALGVRAIRAGIGLLPDQDADGALGLAVDLRSIGPGPAVAGSPRIARYAAERWAWPLSVRTRSTAFPSAAKTARAVSSAGAALVAVSSGTWTTIERLLRSSNDDLEVVIDDDASPQRVSVDHPCIRWPPPSGLRAGWRGRSSLRMSTCSSLSFASRGRRPFRSGRRRTLG